MHRITPVLFLLLGVAACGGSDEAATTTQPDTTAAITTAVDDSSETTVTESEETTQAETTATTDTTTDTTSGEEPDDEVGALCSAFLASVTPGTYEQGFAELASILGADAPVGVQEALDTLQDPGDDVEAFFRARNSIDGYVLPICEQRFRSSIVPEADNPTAATAFIDALRNGDRSSAERLAPTNIVVQFDWSGYPEMTANADPDNATLSMVLEPTVTVFCQLDGGSIEFCAFGE